MRAIKHAHQKGIGQKRTASMLNVSRAIVRRTLAGDTTAGAKIAARASVIAAVKNSGLHVPLKRALPTQLKEIDPAMHRLIKEKCRLWGYVICARWWNVTPEELQAHVFSRSKVDATEFARNVQVLGIPDMVLKARYPRLRVVTARADADTQGGAI